MVEMRCKRCGKLLGKYSGVKGNVEIKCPRCKELNIVILTEHRESAS